MAPASYTPSQCALAGQLGTSTLFEAGGIAASAVDPAIRAVWPGAALAAPAFPLQCAPGDNLAIHVALTQAPRGSVLVVDAGGFVAGHWGEVLTVAAEAAGVVGLVIDGSVRDIAALARRRFPVFARGISVRGTVKDRAPSVGQPVVLAGTPVSAGDLVVADDDGVLVLPAVQAEATLARGAQRAAREAAFMARLQQGQSTLALLGLQAGTQP